MPKYNYPYKVSILKFIFNSSTIAKNPIPFHKKLFNESKTNSFSINPYFNKPILLTRDAEFAKYILQKKHKHFEKSKIQTTYLAKYIGYGLLTSKGSYWLQQRRLIQPAFHKEKINNLIAIINQTVKEQVSKIRPNGFQPLYPLMNVLAFEVIAKSLFNFSAEKQTLERLQFIIEKLQRFIIKDVRQPHKRLWYILKGDVKKHMKLVAESRTIITSIIEQRKTSKENHDDLLDMLLNVNYEDGSSMTNEQLIDEILILFVAGHETTANALTFTFFLLANNKETLEKARQEALGFNNEDLSMHSFSSLEYIKQCVEESMRLYPPAWITDRVALQDETLGEHTIEKGTMIGISIYEMHRNTKYWKDPNVFNPERFSAENRKNIANFYMPFGAGPRLCIGNNFAMFEMILVVQNILKNFTIETNKTEVKVNPLITLKPVDVEIKFT